MYLIPLNNQILVTANGNCIFMKISMQGILESINLSSNDTQVIQVLLEVLNKITLLGKDVQNGY